MAVGLLLPAVVDSKDRCVGRLADLLASKAGIDSAHALTTDDDTPDQICIHYDPDVLSTGQVRELAKRAGAALDERFGHLLTTFHPTHARRASAVEARLTRVDGVVEAVMSPDGELRVEYERELTDEETILNALSGWLDTEEARADSERQDQDAKDDHTGHDHEGHDHAGHVHAGHDHEHDRSKHGHAGGHHHSHGGIFGERTELIFAMLCGVCLLAGWVLEAFVAGTPPWLPFALFVGAYFFGGYFTVAEALEKIRAGQFEIDFLMIVAAGGAAALGAWAEGALLLFLFSIGHALEGYAMGRAKQAIESLAELAPRMARVRRSGKESEVPVEDLVVGDLIVVKPNERIASDGFVTEGESSVDQAPITGESVPVDKRPVDHLESAAAEPDSISAEHRVYAGTINQAGALIVRVTRTASQSTLARVVTMVNEAETRISPTQAFTKKFERYFVPAVVVVVVLLLFAPLVLKESFADSFYRSMAVLVAASPCALAIATPSAVLSGVARAARGGVLVKGGGPLESLGRLDAIAFDKTGTLTEGAPKVTDVIAAEGVADAELLQVAIAVENLSKHPLAKAVVRDGKARLQKNAPLQGVPMEAKDLRSITGRGIQASIDGEPVFLGKDDLFAEIDGPPLPQAIQQTVENLESNGRTTVIVRRGKSYLGVIGLMDTPRKTAKQTIQRLRELGIRRMILISGDNQQVADAVAREVGIDEARGDLMPDDKVTEIRKLRGEAGVAMVGDGVNDAPAMANATVGIAMGAAGSDVALETADVALMADDLTHLPFAVGLSRQTRSIIRQNLWMSLGMVALLVPATILGLNIGPAVALHEGSTLLVVFNALRLLAYKDV